MGQVALKSRFITNRDAQPAVLSNPALAGGELHSAVGTVSIGTSDTGSGTPASASTYRFCQIPSNARISGVYVSTSAVPGGGSAAMDFGFYETTQNGGAILNTDGDQIAAAVDIHTAVLTRKDVTYQGGEEDTVINADKMVWELLGLTSDPNKSYDVVGTLTTSNSTAGFDMAVEVVYVV